MAVTMEGKGGEGELGRRVVLPGLKRVQWRSEMDERWHLGGGSKLEQVPFIHHWHNLAKQTFWLN